MPLLVRNQVGRFETIAVVRHKFTRTFSVVLFFGINTSSGSLLGSFMRTYAGITSHSRARKPCCLAMFAEVTQARKSRFRNHYRSWKTSLHVV